MEANFPSRHTDHNRIMILTGVSGCGKDYLLTRTNMSSAVRLVNFGQALYEHLRSLSPQVKSRDDMSGLLNQEQVKQGVKILINSIIQSQPVVLNTHVVYWQNGIPTSNPDIEAQLNAMQYVFVWADPAQIFAQRLQDANRSRAQATIEEIAQRQEEALKCVSAIASQFYSSITTILNRSGNVEENTKILSRLMKTLVD